jgi:hypothetical protein
MPIQVDDVFLPAMSGTELSRVRTEFRLRLPEPINKSLLESRGRHCYAIKLSTRTGLVRLCDLPGVSRDQCIFTWQKQSAREVLNRYSMRLISQRSLIFCLGKFPDRYQRQSCGESHEQTNCFPLSIWILHILLLGTGIDTPDAFSMFARPIALLLTGHALDYEPFFFRVNQVLPRRNVLQPIYSRARFFNFRHGSDPNRLAVS